MSDAEILIKALAVAMARDHGEDPEALVNVAASRQPAMMVAAWLRWRPTALGLVAALKIDVGEAGVRFLDSALRLVQASATLDGRGGA